MADKPRQIFDRDVEWRHLAALASHVAQRPQVGIVSGRRRQGTTYLLEALALLRVSQALPDGAGRVAGHVGQSCVLDTRRMQAVAKYRGAYRVVSRVFRCIIRYGV
ncbi:MAG: hypothetical protein ACRD0K_15790 [Egibacteraceae bacterium]